MNKKTNLSKIFNILNILLAVVIVCITALSFKAEYIQMSELGEVYRNVFKINIIEKLWIMLVVFALTFIFIVIINKSLKKEFKRLSEKDDKNFKSLMLPNFSIAILLGVINAVISQVVFRGKILDLINVGWFGKPLSNIGLDYNFVMIISPILQKILFYLGGCIIFSILYAFVYFLYVVNMQLDGIDSKDLKNSSFVRIFRRLGMIILFIALAIFVIRIFDIFSGDMFKKNAPESIYLNGASHADVTLRFWGNIILAVVFFILIFKLNKNIKKENGMKVMQIVIAVPVLIFALNTLIFVYKSIFIGKNVLEKENKYIEKNIEATEEAFGIKLNTKVIEEAKELNKDDISQIEKIGRKIPIISEEMAWQNIESLKSKDSSFKYTGINITSSNDSIKYFMPRELKEEKKRTIDGKTYIYNHGYFGALTDATQTDEEGFLKLDEKTYDNPILSGKKIEEPRIYYGINTYKSTVVGENIDEFDYEIINKETKEKEIRSNKYNGTGGKDLSFKEAALLSIYNLDPNIFIEGRKKGNRTLFNRQIIERAKKVLPQLSYDEKPYLIPNENGGTSWVIDAYTASNKYPYSQKVLSKDDRGNIGRINYIKNSVKVIIDAYNGNIDFYIMDESDPFAKQIQNKYKKLFKNKDEMPKIIKENLLYPKKLYDIQAKVIENYHKISSDSLFKSEDIWEISSVKKENNKTIEARYINLSDENNKNTKLSLVTMYTPLNKQNIKGYLLGNIENGENKLTLVKFDQNENFLSLNFMKDKIHEDEKAKSELDKLNRLGIELVRDTMLVPINTSILYVEPVYQVHLNEKSVPVLKKVVVANGNKVGIGENFNEAINNLFTDAAININMYDPNNFSTLLDSIISRNADLKESLKSNNWNYIGKDIEKLTSLIEQLQKAKAKEDERVNKEKIENKRRDQKEEAINQDNHKIEEKEIEVETN